MHRSTNPLRRVSVLLFFALISTSVFGQTTIRERVEIQPKVQQSVFSHSGSSSVLHQVDATKGAVSFPGVTLTVTGVSVNVPILPWPNNNVAGLYIEFRADASGGGAFPLKRYYVCEGNVTEQVFPLPTLNLSSCGQVYVLYKVISWSGFARCHPRESLYKFAQASVGGSGGTFTIQDTVFNAFSVPVPVSATVTISASSIPGSELAQVIPVPGKTTLQCLENSLVNVSLKNGNGQTMALCSGTTLQATASLEGAGPYAFLRQGTHEGQMISFPVSTSTFSFTAVLDTSRGVIPLGNQQATLRVTVDGVEGTANINLTCHYPPPAVTITHPAQDTTIVLTQENQPILILQEVHSPTSGKFEPQISWEPSQTINTADYFEQIQDSLVITVKARARNIAEMEALDSVRITLKVQHCALVEFANPELSPGDTTLLTFKKLTESGPVEFPPGQLFDLFIVNPTGNGLLLSSTGTTGTTLIGVAAPVYYIAPNSLAGDSLLVSIRAVTSAQTVPSARFVNTGVTAASFRRVGQDENQGEGSTQDLEAYLQELFARAVEVCPAPSKVVVRQSIMLKVSIVQSETTPSGFVNVIVEATKNGQPAAGITVQLEAKGVEGTGGHDHIGNRPKGEFIVSNGRTSETGKYATLYVASKFGGKERIIVKSTETTGKDSVDLIVRVPNLVPLESGRNHIITMHTSADAERKHAVINSNYGTPNVVARVAAAVLEYAQALELMSGMFLAAIDMSLPSGGLFDIGGNWQPPHSKHRFGRSIDFSRFYVNASRQIISVPVFVDGEQRGTTNRVNEDVLDDRFDRRGFDRYERSIGKIHYESRN